MEFAPMGKIGLPLYLAFIALMLVGCSKTPLSAADDAGKEPKAIKVEQMDAVTSGSSRQAILSLHKKYAYEDACKFGLTLINRLPYKITNIAFRFAAYVEGDVFYRHVTRNFFEIDPAADQYREITFVGVSCDKISYLEVMDPGRCTLGQLTRPSSQPGNCIRWVHIAQTPYVRLVRK